MSTTTVSLRTAVAMVAGAAALVLSGVYVARAAPGGETASTLSFAGTLTGVSGPQKLTFAFKKNGAATCSPTGIDVMVTPDPATGNFQAAIPLATCASSLFDGSDVALDVSVGGTMVVTGQPVGPVPYARYADKVGSPDCPVGYDRAGSAPPIVCLKGADEIVKVGTGAAAFWIDRYEASVWSDPAGTVGVSPGVPYGTAVNDYPATFPSSGQVANQANLMYAVSKAKVLPSANLTWFQANLACFASGKRLPRGPEWLLAATGTADPGFSAGNEGSCVTGAGMARSTGATKAENNCVSIWGAQDMIGNLGEVTDEWYAGLGNGNGSGVSTWGSDASYAQDSTWNIASGAYNGLTTELNLPAAAVRGGAWGDAVQAGVFALFLNGSPSNAGPAFGFRCVLPR